ncbi:unnamed protein product [Urochloa decumbens]|uniref:Uncharacterized protein n=1 Tax=Urochloa decumbens TaxID=240449 RepID=A0ABC9D730_9POAL
MDLKTGVLAILLVVSLVSADVVKGQQLGGSEGQELAASSSSSDGGSNNEVSPKKDCRENKLYQGPCVDLMCATACFIQLHLGGHCKGAWFWGGCYCFAC